MSYVNATFHLDYENGSDAVRSTLSGATVSNPSGSVTRVNYVGHGLVTGAIVTLSGFTAWLNGTWKITWVDANNFDLDGAVWQATADATGDVVPFGGMDWTDAWKTITSGATAARIAPSDIVKIAKSPAPASVGNATWTDKSKTITLATAQTQTIDNCETNWTANGSGDVTPAQEASCKEGSKAQKLTFDASPQTSIMQAYFQISELNLSTYQKVSFWLKNEAAITAGTLRLALCSDTAGATPVDYIDIPAIPSTTRFIPLTIAKTGGGNLGASIKSVALYTDGAVTGLASKYIVLDNIIACTTSGLNLQSLISKNSAEYAGTEAWYPIKSIDGTTVLIDNDTSCTPSQGMGYSGDTETVTTYKRETIKTDMVASSSTAVQAIQDNGTYGNLIYFKGGYNTSTGDQDGETFFDGLNGNGYGISSNGKDYVHLERVSGVRYYYAVYLLNGDHCNFTVNFATGCNGTGAICSGNLNIFNVLFANNNGYANSGQGVYISGYENVCTVGNASSNYTIGVMLYNDNKIKGAVTAKNNYAYGLSVPSEISVVDELITADNGTASISNAGRRNYIQKATISEATICSNFGAWMNGRTFINNLNASGSQILCEYGNVVAQTATAGGTGIEWKMSPTNVARDIDYPLKLSVAKIACVADKEVTVKLYFKKSHATDIGARLYVEGGQLAGVDEDYTEAPDDTSRNQVTLTFTPTEAGVIEIEAWAYWEANTADENVIVDDIEITQAA